MQQAWRPFHPEGVDPVVRKHTPPLLELSRVCAVEVGGGGGGRGSVGGKERGSKTERERDRDGDTLVLVEVPVLYPNSSYNSQRVPRLCPACPRHSDATRRRYLVAKPGDT